MKPILKWAGGKSALLDEIIKRLPTYVHERDFCLVEPFVGNKVYTFSGITFSYKLVDNNTLNVYIQNTVSVYKKN